MDERLFNTLNEILGEIRLLIKLDREISRELAELESTTGISGGIIHFKRRKFEQSEINSAKLNELLKRMEYFIIEDNKLRNALRQFSISISLEKRGVEEVKFSQDSHKRIFEYLAGEIEFLISHANHVHDHAQALIGLLQSGTKSEELKEEIIELDRLFRKIRIILVKIEHELIQDEKKIARSQGESYITRVLGVKNVSKSRNYVRDFDSLGKIDKIRVSNAETRIQTRPEYDKEYHELLGYGGIRHARYSKGGRILYIVKGNTLNYERILRPEEHSNVHRIAMGLAK